MKFNTVITSVVVYFMVVIIGCFVTSKEITTLTIKEFIEINNCGGRMALFVAIIGGIRGVFIRNINNNN